MSIILQQLVKTRGGFFSFGTRPAVIELHDDNRFVMFNIDKQTQLRTDTVMDVPLAGLRVKKEGTLLDFSSGSTKRRVDFANDSQYVGLAAGGLIGMAIANSVSESSSGIRTWIDALRAHGARVSTPFISTTALVIIAVPLVLTVLLVAAALIANIGR